MRTRDDALLRAQASLTTRDLRLLAWLYDHKLLTTPQIAHALFGSLSGAQKRLLDLVERGVLDRFRPQRWDGGSYPYHYLLAQLGLEVVAGQRQIELPRRDAARRLRAHENGEQIPFLVEVDLGTETVTGVLVAKVEAYQRVYGTYARWRWPVLFVVPTLRREANLHTALNRTATTAPIATTARELLDDAGLTPAEPVWRLLGHDGPRQRLIRLPWTDHPTAGFDPATPTTGPATTVRDRQRDHHSHKLRDAA